MATKFYAAMIGGSHGYGEGLPWERLGIPSSLYGPRDQGSLGKLGLEFFRM